MGGEEREDTVEEGVEDIAEEEQENIVEEGSINIVEEDEVGTGAEEGVNFLFLLLPKHPQGSQNQSLISKKKFQMPRAL